MFYIRRTGKQEHTIEKLSVKLSALLRWERWFHNYQVDVKLYLLAPESCDLLL